MSEQTVRIQIYTDPDPEDPRQFDDTSVMVCAHRRYTLGDKDAERPPKDAAIAWPIYMYDHSGLTISHSPFSCPWDSGQLGEHYITQEAFETAFAGDRERAEAYMRRELELYDAYIRGDVWEMCVTLADADEMFVQGSGRSLEDTGFLECVAPEHHVALREAWDNRFERRSQEKWLTGTA